MKDAMKADYIYAGFIGLLLGLFTLQIFSFYLYERQVRVNILEEKEFKRELVKQAALSCDPLYSEVHAAVYRDRMVLECIK